MVDGETHELPAFVGMAVFAKEPCPLPNRATYGV